MKNLIIKELRKSSYVPGKQRTWVSHLSDNQLYELYIRLKNGETAKSIARHIQKKWGINPQSTIHSLSQGILKFQKRITDLLEASPLEMNCLSADQPLENLEQMGGLETNQRIARSLRKRIQDMIKEEKESGIKHPYLSRDIQALTTLEKTIVKMKELSIKHPHDDPITILENKRKDQKIDNLFNKYMEITTEDYRDRVIKFLNIFVKMAEERAITVVTQPDGEYKLIYPEDKNQDQKQI